MGTITVNVDDATEESFRSRVYQIYGKRKGSLGQAITEAMYEWSRKKEYFDQCMELLMKGVNMGKLKYKSREELHDRR